MLSDRIVVILILVPIGTALLVAGGWPLMLGALFFVNGAALEYGALWRRTGIQVPAWLLCGGASALILFRAWAGFDHAPILLTALILACVVWFISRYGPQDPHAATGLMVTLGGLAYLGWFGAYFISLRNLPDGLWWSLTVLPAVWLTDSMAYLTGMRFGRHHMTPNVSPKKTWEGYAGGIAGGAVAGMVLAGLWSLTAGPQSGLNAWHGLIVGLAIGALSPIGDLAVSMIKRETGAKDSGMALPGHGGMLDRIDSWLLTAAIGYYMVVALQNLR